MIFTLAWLLVHLGNFWYAVSTITVVCPIPSHREPILQDGPWRSDFVSALRSLTWTGRTLQKKKKSYLELWYYINPFNHVDRCRQLDANSVDPDETAHYEPSHQDPHCLQFYLDVWLRPLFGTMELLTRFKDGRVLFRNSGMTWLWLRGRVHALQQVKECKHLKCLSFFIPVNSNIWNSKMTRKGTAKLTELLQIEEQMQQKWDSENMFELDAPEPGTLEAK